LSIEELVRVGSYADRNSQDEAQPGILPLAIQINEIPRIER